MFSDRRFMSFSLWFAVKRYALSRKNKRLSYMFSSLIFGIIFFILPPVHATEIKTHALSLIGTPHYGPDATHLDWVNPNAPKGGTLNLAVRGTFDSLNPFSIKGNAVTGLGLTLPTLMATHAGEMSTEYGFVAESVRVPDDLTYVRFDLNPKARFHDGTPITVEDVIFSFDLLTGPGVTPLYRSYYADVDRAEKTGNQQVTFFFTGPPNRELPQIVGQLPILSQKDWSDRDVSSALQDESFLGAGPYRVADFEPGRYIEYERIPDWWASDLLINQGQYNFNRIRYDYYLDDNALRLSFQKGLTDFRQENTSLHWARSYEFPAVQDGRVIKAERPNKMPRGMQGFVFNTRRPVLVDRQVRRAISLAFDFEWTNRERLFMAYTRTTSFFQNSEFASSGLPSPDERVLLDPLKDFLPTDLFDQPFKLPITDGSGRNRTQLREAKKILDGAGWRVGDDQILRNQAGDAMEIEIILVSPAFERLVDPFIQNMRKLGIQARMTLLTQPEYIARMRTFDYDMTITTWGQSNSPGNEQRDMWSSAAATQPDSRNYAGIQNPGIDSLIDSIVAAKSRAELITATRALDRALLWGYYVIPQWHVDKFRIAYWDRFGQPKVTPDFGVGLLSWWEDTEKASLIDASDKN